MAARSRLAARIEELGYPQSKLAHLVGVHVSTVRRWLDGQTDPRRYQRRPLADALRVPLEPTRDRHELDWYLLCDDELPPGPADRFEDVDRRELLAALGTTFAGALAGPAKAFAAPKDVPPDLAGYFADLLTDHHATEVQIGAHRPLLETVTTQHRMIRQAADAARGDVRHQLLSVDVGYANLAGWLHEDAGDVARAWQWHSTALELAHHTHNPSLIAYALANLAYLRVDGGDIAGAVDLADSAVATPGLLGDARRYVLRDVAGTYALAGASDALDRTLTEEAETTPHGEDDYPWDVANIGLSPAYIDACRATSYGQSGQTTEAADLWPTVLDQYAPTDRRSRGVYNTRYAAALLDVDSPDAALTPATEAVDCIQAAPSARMRRELTQLRDQAARLDSAAGRDLHELLKAV